MTERQETLTSARRRWRLPRLVIVLVLIAGAVGLMSVAWLGFGLDPFRSQSVESSSPPLLLQVRNIAEYHAATGTFEVLVDVDHTTSNVPSFISSEHTTLFATGTADATVDFSQVGPDRVTVSADHRSAAIALPAPTLASAIVDPARSRIVGQERGLLERAQAALGDAPVNNQELYALAGQKLDGAARSSDLVERAEQNTRTMLTTLAGSLGVARVTVTFDAPDQR